MKHTQLNGARILTVPEVSEFLKVHPSTIYRLLKTSQIPAFKVGSDWRFNLFEIEHWSRERETKPK
jgi:excisionase family DNA binding protein